MRLLINQRERKMNENKIYIAKEILTQAAKVATEVNLLAMRSASDTSTYKQYEAVDMISTAISDGYIEETENAIDDVLDYTMFYIAARINNNPIELCHKDREKSKEELMVKGMFDNLITEFKKEFFYEIGCMVPHEELIKEGLAKNFQRALSEDFDVYRHRLRGIFDLFSKKAYSCVYSEVYDNYYDRLPSFRLKNYFDTCLKILSMRMSFITKEVYIDKDRDAQVNSGMCDISYERAILQRFDPGRYNNLDFDVLVEISNGKLDPKGGDKIIAKELWELEKEEEDKSITSAEIMTDIIDMSTARACVAVKGRIATQFKITNDEAMEVVSELKDWINSMTVETSVICYTALLASSNRYQLRDLNEHPYKK